MKRLATDKPRNNTETALNLFFIKDGETWVRGGSSDPCVHDVTLNEFIRRVAHEHKADELFDLDTNDVELSEQMADALFYGIDTMEGLIATLYTVGWAFAELRSKAKAALTLADGRSVEVKHQDVIYLENVYRMPV